jgi:hypothetical protein
MPKHCANTFFKGRGARRLFPCALSKSDDPHPARLSKSDNFVLTCPITTQTNHRPYCGPSRTIRIPVGFGVLFGHFITRHQHLGMWIA